jgi:hypothetical protein
MKKAQPHAMPPASLSELGYLASLAPRFFRVVKDFESYAEHNKSGYGHADYLRAGDVMLAGGSVHQTKVRIATPTKRTHYCLLGHGVTADYRADGAIRPLTRKEFLAVIPHMTSLIWFSEGQYELRNMICRLLLTEGGEEEAQKLIAKYY